MNKSRAQASSFWQALETTNRRHRILRNVTVGLYLFATMLLVEFLWLEQVDGLRIYASVTTVFVLCLILFSRPRCRVSLPQKSPPV